MLLSFFAITMSIIDPSDQTSYPTIMERKELQKFEYFLNQWINCYKIL